MLQNGRSRVFCPVTKKRRRRLQGGFDAPFFDRRLSIIVGRLGAQRDSVCNNIGKRRAMIKRTTTTMSRPPPEGEKRLLKKRARFPTFSNNNWNFEKRLVPIKVGKREGKNGKIIFKKCKPRRKIITNKGFEIKRTSTPRPERQSRRSRCRRRPLKPP